MRGSSQSGFTLIELMVVVVIVGVLASVAVWYFGRTTRTAKASEVHAMFAELRNRELQYHNEYNTYLSTGTSDTDYWPTPPSRTAKSIAPMPASWVSLRLTPGKSALYCGYVAIAGDANDATNLGPAATKFGLTAAPVRDWFYLVAECDFDSDPANNSFYFTHSGITNIMELNPGR